MGARFVDEVNDDTTFDAEGWIDANWDPEMTAGEWLARLARARLSNPMLAPPWGRASSRARTGAFAKALTAKGASGPPGGPGMHLVLPTLLAHGTSEVITRFVPNILNGQHAWCQLFSEPGAGSDLAGLQTQAVHDGEEWVVNGQKVWTSSGQWADYAILIARSDRSLPKHRGITYFALPMLQPGVEVRPLREMTGRALFNEVFLTDVRVANENVIGEVNGGWKVANTTLSIERLGIGHLTPSAFTSAIAGSVAGHLNQRAGQFLQGQREISGGTIGRGRVKQLTELARTLGRADDPVVRQDLARLHSLVEITGWHTARMKAGAARTGGEGNIAKLRNTAMIRLARDLATGIMGMHATIVGPTSLSGGDLQEMTLFSPAPSIYGGTDEVQRNILAERVLGLARESGPPSDTPFDELLRNQ